ncbi:MAG: TonB-dependent receptor [Bacteroidota bacterium]
MQLRILLAVQLIMVGWTAYTQNLTQTVRGRIVDEDTQGPLIGATVMIIGSDPIQGATTDLEGEFRIEQVAVGRVDLLVRYIGYEERVLPGLLVGAAKEAVLDIPMAESIEALQEVVVTAKQDKSEVLNEMALVSARSFTVDETKRFAGSLNDPARMVASYAGVQSNAEGSNEIVVRGNSSRGILWRLEGVEIPNPNHFADEGSTGGPINALNSTMLNDSDFFTGAFAPEYGNALSGVFDMQLRKGNNEQREYTFTASTLGLDFTAEGPFANNYNGSYLVNYRYSSLALIAEAGLMDFGGVPKYQDLSFKVDLPVNKRHFLTLFGLGGLSQIGGDEENDEGELTYRFDFSGGMGVTGLVHNYLINDRMFIKNIVSVSGTANTYNDNIPDGEGWKRIEENDISKSTVRVSSAWNYKINARNKLEIGGIYSRERFDIMARSLNFETDVLETDLSDAGSTDIYQGYASWRLRPTEDLTMTTGLHYLHFGFNNNFSVEPRFGLRWDFAERQAFTAGFGMHSKLESIAIYLGRQQNEDGSYTMNNEDLEISKSAHFVMGYDRMLSENTHFKIEGYYQHLYDIPVENDRTSAFSLSNFIEGYTTLDLVNEGTGRNYGVELTLERYLTRGFYYLGTVSLYRSLYTALDGVERSSMFDGNYVANFLAGKEFAVGRPEKQRTLFVNGKLAFIGGARYTPIDLEASRELGTAVDGPLLSEKGDDVLVTNLAVGWRRDKKNTTREFKIDVQNVTNAQATVREYYVEATEEISISKQLPFFPTISYSISF